jgi:hypothetical protein
MTPLFVSPTLRRAAREAFQAVRHAGHVSASGAEVKSLIQ